MITEDNTMHILQYDVEFTIPYLGKFGNVRISNILKNIFVTVGFVSHVYLNSGNITGTIFIIVLKILYVSIWAMYLCYVLTNITRSKGLKEIYKDITEVNVQLNASLSQHDWRLLTLLAFYYWQFIIMAVYLLARGMRDYELPLAAVSTVSQEIVAVATLKYLIAKRLRYIRSAEEYIGRIEDTVFNTRQLLECNQTINNVYGLLSTTFVVYIFQLVLVYIYTMWVAFAAGKEIAYNVLSHPTLFSLWIVTECSTAVVLAIVSSLVVDEVEEVKVELDVTLSARPCTENQWNLVHVFLMELHHTPVQLSAMGLFNIAGSSISSACSTITSYLLVLIQYS